MEFPNLGKNCYVSSCKQLDFLPMKCDACSNIFCGDHIKYDTHNCTESYKKDNQVPVCPLCNEAISVKKGDLPDVVVSRHIDNDCSSDLAKQRRKIYTNKCSFKGCKQKELVPVKCDNCHKNYCLRHRHETDHKCEGFENTGRGISSAGAAAVSRIKAGGSSSSKPASQKSHTPQQTSLASMGRDLDRERRERQQRAAPRAATVQGALSEDEALARALQLSMAESQSQQQATQNPKRSLTAQEQEDLQLAQALAASEEEEALRARRRQQQQQNRQDRSICEVS